MTSSPRLPIDPAALAAVDSQIRSPVEFLEPEEITRVHEASLEILEEIGPLVRNPKARQRLIDHGCRTEDDGEIVKFPAAVVEKYRKMVPPTFTFRGRDPAFDFTLPRAIPAVATASSAPDIVDPVSALTRRATSADIARIGHLVNELDGFDVFSISVLADDAPEGQFSLSRFYPALKNCAKPCRTSVINRREADQVLKLGHEIAGSPERFAERPFITFGYCSIVSPLTMDFDSTEMLMYYAENGIAAYGTIAPMGGISTPLTLPGLLVQMNAEWLATAVLAQMSRPETNLIYNFLPVFADMRDGAYAAGAIEIGMMNSAVCQMARYYDVPGGGYLGLTNSKVSDAQAGFEKGMSPLLGTLSGVDFIVMGGLLDALMSFDFGQAVIDNEIALMLKRVARGFEFSEGALSLDDIKAAGPAGMFAGLPSTLQRMTETTFLPSIADRELREKWVLDGATESHSRALAKAQEILTKPNKRAIDGDTDARVRAAFEGLVAGASTPPDGWTTPDTPVRRGRRENRRRRRSAS